MKRKNVDSFNIPEVRREVSDLRDVFSIVGQPRHQHEPQPDRSFPRSKAAGKLKNRTIVVSGKSTVPFRIPRFDVEQYEVDGKQVLVREVATEVAIGVQRGVNTHTLRRPEELRGKPMLHQRLTTAQCESPGHRLQPVTVLAEFFGGSRDGDGNTVAHRPGIRVMAIEAAPDASSCPGDHANSRTVYRRSCSERMKEPHISRCECGANVGLRQVPAQMDTQIERAFGLQRWVVSRTIVLHGITPHGKY